MNAPRKKNEKNKKRWVLFVLKIFFLVLFFALFVVFYFSFPLQNTVSFSDFYISDFACLITSLGIEVSFVTYIEQTIYNRSYRHDVLVCLTTNTIFDCFFLSFMAVVVGIFAFYLPSSFSISVLSTAFTSIDIAIVFLSMYFLSNEADPIKQARTHMKKYFSLYEASSKDDSFSEWADVRSIVEGCLSSGEYLFCERIALDWSVRVYRFIEAHNHEKLDEKGKEAIIEKEEHLVASFSFFIALDFGNAGRDSLLRIVHQFTRVAVCLKLDGFLEASQTVEKTLFMFFQSNISDETSLCILFRSFFLVDKKAKRSDYFWSKRDPEKPGEYVQTQEEIIFQICGHLVAEGKGSGASTISSLLVQELPSYLLEPENPTSSDAFSLFLEVLLAFLNSPFPEGSELSVQSYFSEISKKKDETKLHEYIDKFLLSDDLQYKCIRNMPFADLILTQINQSLLFGYKTKELFAASFKLADSIVWAEEGVVSSDIIPSNENLSEIIKENKITAEDLVNELRPLFIASASNEQTGYLEKVLSSIDFFVFQPTLPFDQKNPYLRFYFSIFDDIEQSSREITQKAIAHFDKNIRRASQEKKLTEKTLDDICEEIETRIVWKATSSPHQAVDLAWFLRNLVEKRAMISLCEDSENAAKIVYSHLSSCGESAVEDGQTEVLQIMSAALGWGAVWEFRDRKRFDLSGFILKRGTRLFVLCLNVLGDCSSSVFVGTLVAIHGAYSLFMNNTIALNTIMGQLHEARMDPLPVLHKSIDLRKNQSSWEDLFSKDPKKYFNDFWKTLQNNPISGNP